MENNKHYYDNSPDKKAYTSDYHKMLNYLHSTGVSDVNDLTETTPPSVKYDLSTSNLTNSDFTNGLYVKRMNNHQLDNINRDTLSESLESEGILSYSPDITIFDISKSETNIKNVGKSKENIILNIFSTEMDPDIRVSHGNVDKSDNETKSAHLLVKNRHNQDHSFQNEYDEVNTKYTNFSITNGNEPTQLKHHQESNISENVNNDNTTSEMNHELYAQYDLDNNDSSGYYGVDLDIDSSNSSYISENNEYYSSKGKSQSQAGSYKINNALNYSCSQFIGYNHVNYVTSSFNTSMNTSNMHQDIKDMSYNRDSNRDVRDMNDNDRDIRNISDNNRDSNRDNNRDMSYNNDSNRDISGNNRDDSCDRDINDNHRDISGNNRDVSYNNDNHRDISDNHRDVSCEELIDQSHNIISEIDDFLNNLEVDLSTDHSLSTNQSLPNLHNMIYDGNKENNENRKYVKHHNNEGNELIMNIDGIFNDLHDGVGVGDGVGLGVGLGVANSDNECIFSVEGDDICDTSRLSGLTEQIPEDISEQVTEKITEEVTKEVSEQITKQITDQTTEEVIEVVTNDTTLDLNENDTHVITEDHNSIDTINEITDTNENDTHVITEDHFGNINETSNTNNYSNSNDMNSSTHSSHIATDRSHIITDTSFVSTSEQSTPRLTPQPIVQLTPKSNPTSTLVYTSTNTSALVLTPTFTSTGSTFISTPRNSTTHSSPTNNTTHFTPTNNTTYSSPRNSISDIIPRDSMNDFTPRDSRDSMNDSTSSDSRDSITHFTPRDSMTGFTSRLDSSSYNSSSYNSSTNTNTNTNTNINTITNTNTNISSQTHSPSNTPTHTLSPTHTHTHTHNNTYTPSPSNTPSHSLSHTLSHTPSDTPSPSQTTSNQHTSHQHTSISRESPTSKRSASPLTSSSLTSSPLTSSPLTSSSHNYSLNSMNNSQLDSTLDTQFLTEFGPKFDSVNNSMNNSTFDSKNDLKYMSEIDREFDLELEKLDFDTTVSSSNISDQDKDKNHNNIRVEKNPEKMKLNEKSGFGEFIVDDPKRNEMDLNIHSKSKIKDQLNLSNDYMTDHPDSPEIYHHIYTIDNYSEASFDLDHSDSEFNHVTPFDIDPLFSMTNINFKNNDDMHIKYKNTHFEDDHKKPKYEVEIDEVTSTFKSTQISSKIPYTELDLEYDTMSHSSTTHDDTSPNVSHLKYYTELSQKTNTIKNHQKNIFTDIEALEANIRVRKLQEEVNKLEEVLVLQKQEITMYEKEREVYKTTLDETSVELDQFEKILTSNDISLKNGFFSVASILHRFCLKDKDSNNQFKTNENNGQNSTESSTDSSTANINYNDNILSTHDSSLTPNNNIDIGINFSELKLPDTSPQTLSTISTLSTPTVQSFIQEIFSHTRNNTNTNTNPLSPHLIAKWLFQLNHILTHLTTELTGKQEDLTQLLALYQDSEFCLNELQEIYQENAEHVTSFKNTISDLNNQITKLNAENVKANDEILKNTTEIEHLNIERDNLEKSVRERDIEKDRLIAQMENEISNLKKTTEMLEDHVKIEKTKKDHQISENEKLHDRMAGLLKEKVENEILRKTWIEREKSLLTMTGDRDEETKTLKQENMKLIEELTRLKDSLDVMNNEIHNITSACVDSGNINKKNMNSNDNPMSFLNQYITDLNDENHQLNDVNTQLNLDISRLSEENSILKEKLIEMSEKMSAMASSIPPIPAPTPIPSKLMLNVYKNIRKKLKKQYECKNCLKLPCQCYTNHIKAEKKKHTENLVNSLKTQLEVKNTEIDEITKENEFLRKTLKKTNIDLQQQKELVSGSVEIAHIKQTATGHISHGNYEGGGGGGGGGVNMSLNNTVNNISLNNEVNNSNMQMNNTKNKTENTNGKNEHLIGKPVLNNNSVAFVTSFNPDTNIYDHITNISTDFKNPSDINMNMSGNSKSNSNTNMDMKSQVKVSTETVFNSFDDEYIVINPNTFYNTSTAVLTIFDDEALQYTYINMDNFVVTKVGKEGTTTTSFTSMNHVSSFLPDYSRILMYIQDLRHAKTNFTSSNKNTSNNSYSDINLIGNSDHTNYIPNQNHSVTSNLFNNPNNMKYLQGIKISQSSQEPPSHSHSHSPPNSPPLSYQDRLHHAIQQQRMRVQRHIYPNFTTPQPTSSQSRVSLNSSNGIPSSHITDNHTPTSTSTTFTTGFSTNPSSPINSTTTSTSTSINTSTPTLPPYQQRLQRAILDASEALNSTVTPSRPVQPITTSRPVIGFIGDQFYKNNIEPHNNTNNTNNTQKTSGQIETGLNSGSMRLEALKAQRKKLQEEYEREIALQEKEERNYQDKLQNQTTKKTDDNFYHNQNSTSNHHDLDSFETSPSSIRKSKLMSTEVVPHVMEVNNDEDFLKTRSLFTFVDNPSTHSLLHSTPTTSTSTPSQYSSVKSTPRTNTSKYSLNNSTISHTSNVSTGINDTKYHLTPYTSSSVSPSTPSSTHSSSSTNTFPTPSNTGNTNRSIVSGLTSISSNNSQTRISTSGIHNTTDRTNNQARLNSVVQKKSNTNVTTNTDAYKPTTPTSIAVSNSQHTPSYPTPSTIRSMPVPILHKSFKTGLHQSSSDDYIKSATAPTTPILKLPTPANLDGSNMAFPTPSRLKYDPDLKYSHFNTNNGLSKENKSILISPQIDFISDTKPTLTTGSTNTSTSGLVSKRYSPTPLNSQKSPKLFNNTPNLTPNLTPSSLFKHKGVLQMSNLHSSTHDTRPYTGTSYTSSRLNTPSSTNTLSRTPYTSSVSSLKQITSPSFTNHLEKTPMSLSKTPVSKTRLTPLTTPRKIDVFEKSQKGTKVDYFE